MSPGYVDPPLYDSGVWMELRVWYDLRNWFKGCRVSPGDQETMPASDYRLGDRCDLGRGLALAEHDLGKALPRHAMVVDAGEAEIFGELERQPLLGPPLGVSGLEAAVANGIEERTQRVERAWGRMFLISQGFCLTR